MIALSGVRSSWLMLARNWLFAMLACSASSLASSSWSSICLRSVMSCRVPMTSLGWSGSPATISRGLDDGADRAVG